MKNMKRIIVDKNGGDTINLSQVKKNRPIFAELNGLTCGMFVKEFDRVWTLKLGDTLNATFPCESLQECLLSCEKYGYEFYTYGGDWYTGTGQV